MQIAYHIWIEDANDLQYEYMMSNNFMQFGVSNVIKEILFDMNTNNTILKHLSKPRNPTNPADLMPAINDYIHPCLMPDGNGPMSVPQYTIKCNIYSDYHSNHDCLWIILKKYPLSSCIINV